MDDEIVWSEWKHSAGVIPGNIVAKYSEHKWCTANSKLWNSGIESDKLIVRARKRQTKYTANIYIVSDPKNTENEGKVFLYTFGTKIFEKIKSCIKPEDSFEKVSSYDPFSFWEGANFKLRIKNVAKQRNYDSSSFDPQAPLSNDDSVLEKIWESEYTLKEFLDPKFYLNPQALEKKFRDSIADASIPSVQATASPVQEYRDETTSEEVPSSNKYQEFLNKFKDETSDDLPF